MFTETDLREALCDWANRQPELAPWPGTSTREPRHRRRYAAAIGVVATCVAVAMVVAIPLINEANGPTPVSRKPSPTATIPLGPTIKEAQAVQISATQPGAHWGVFTSDGARRFLALGKSCTTSAQSSCQTVLKQSRDAGLTWTSLPAPPVPPAQYLFNNLYASTADVWIVPTANPNVVDHFAANGKWETIHTPTASGNATAARVVDGHLVLAQATQDSNNCSSTVTVHSLGATAASSYTLSTVTLSTILRATAVSVTPDGGLWVTEQKPSGCEASVPQSKNGIFEQVAPAGGLLGSVKELPSDVNDVQPATGTTAFAQRVGPLGHALAVTHDSGATWSTVPANGVPSIAALTVASAKSLLVTRFVAQDSYHSELYYSGDGGTSFVPVLALDTPYAGVPSIKGLTLAGGLFVLPNNQIGMLNGSTLLLSTDAGQTWHRRGSL